MLYNFHVFDDEEQTRLRALSKQANSFWMFYSLVVPPSFAMVYAYVKFQKSLSPVRAFGATACVLFLGGRLGGFSSSK